MFREFNVKFEDVEMLGGADNLLEGTEITKVIVRGDNNKMSSLDSMLKNCNELDTVDGELDLNGVSDIDNLLEGTELVKSINLKNINNENISANNSFPHVDRINIGGELYNKKAMQNVIASKDWTFDNINYQGTVGDNIVAKEVNIVDDNKATIKDTLEQKAKRIEIIGQTYENLVVGSGEIALLDELTLESIDGSPNEFTPHIEQPVCVETIEGETYQNLIDGKGEYSLTNKVAFIPLGLQPNKDYTLQLDSVGKNDKPITVNLGGTEATIQPINDTSKHHKVVVRTPSTLTTDKLELSGEGVVVNDVMLFEGGSNVIKQDVGYVDGVESIGKNIGSEFSKNIISWLDFNDLDNSINPTIWIDKTRKGNDFILEGFDFDGVTNGIIDGGLQVKKGAKIKANKTYNNIKSMLLCVNPRSGDIGQIDIFGTSPRSIRCCFREGDKYPYIAGVSGKNITSNKSINTVNVTYNLLNNEYNILYFELNDDMSSVQNLIFGYDTNSNAQTTFKSMMLFDRKLNENEIKDMGNLCFDANSTYKIDILTVNDISNLYTGDVTMELGAWNNNGSSVATSVEIRCKNPFTPIPQGVKNGDILFLILSDTTINSNTNLHQYDSNKKYTAGQGAQVSNFTNGVATITIKDISKIQYFSFRAVSSNAKCKWGLYLENNGFIEKIESTQSILLPQPLNKIGEIKDKFYWDDNKGHYCIEQNIDENLEVLDAPNIIDLPHLNKKYSLDTYMPTTYLECTNSPIQPSRILLESNTHRYKPTSLKSNTEYTVQFDCKEKSDKKIKLNLGGSEKEVDAIVGLNHVSITTPSEIDVNTYKDRLFLSGVGNKVDNVIVVEGEMNQYPEYFNGVQSTGELQDDGTYLIGIKTNEGFNISIHTNNPLAKGDKLYWNKSNKRYEIDRNGVIEIPLVEGDIIDLPRLYQRDDTDLVVETGNIKSSNVKIEYLDIN